MYSFSYRDSKNFLWGARPFFSRSLYAICTNLYLFVDFHYSTDAYMNLFSCHTAPDNAL